MPTTVTVCFFAAAREQVGVDETKLELDDSAGGCTTATFAVALLQQYPQLSQLLPRCALALNGEYVQESQSVRSGDEIAVLPPMSGG